MGIVMIKCPQTGRAIATEMKADRERFRASAVFFSRTYCPICQTNWRSSPRFSGYHASSTRLRTYQTGLPGNCEPIVRDLALERVRRLLKIGAPDFAGAVRGAPDGGRDAASEAQQSAVNLRIN
jgi:hypothetical protein